MNTCSLCSVNKSCGGLELCSLSNMSSSSPYAVHKVCCACSDWDNLETMLWSAYYSGSKYVRLVSSIELPKSILWALSYSENNSLQVEVSTSNISKVSEWLPNTLHQSVKCGLFVIVQIINIGCAGVELSQVLKLLQLIRNCGTFQVLLQFGEVSDDYKIGFLESYYMVVDSWGIKSFLCGIDSCDSMWGRAINTMEDNNATS